MQLSALTDKGMELLKLAHKDGFVTKKSVLDNGIYNSGLGYYLTIWAFRDGGLMSEDGMCNDNKKWVLTKKGVLVIEHIMKAERLLGE